MSQSPYKEDSVFAIAAFFTWVAAILCFPAAVWFDWRWLWMALWLALIGFAFGGFSLYLDKWYAEREVLK